MNREQLHELVVTLKQEIDSGRITVNSASTIESLKRVRYSQDGKVDRTTVDGSVRALGLAVLARNSRRRAKEVPLREVQSAYFEMLNGLLGDVFREMRQRGLSVQVVAETLASDPERVETFRKGFPEFSAGIQEFWQNYGPAVDAHLEDLTYFKSIYSATFHPPT
jgi:hypothetical protein